MDEEADPAKFQLKIEAAYTPDPVIAGVPFTVNYRTGNVGGGDLADAGGDAYVYIVARGVFERTAWITASEDRWQAGVSYHSSDQAKSATSVSIDELEPFEITLRRPGPSWVFVAVVAHDELGDEIGFHGI